MLQRADGRGESHDEERDAEQEQGNLRKYSEADQRPIRDARGENAQVDEQVGKAP